VGKVGRKSVSAPVAKKKKQKTKKEFNKYQLYEASVQCVESDLDFLNEKYKEIRGKSATPLILREDFSGTGKLCCEWVKQGKKYVAHGVDLDPEPIEYGKEHHYGPLSDAQKKQVTYHQKNVLDATDIKADIVVAFNFSYFIFKKRRQLLEYFKEVRKSLRPGGVFFLDLFGGPESQTLCVEETEYEEGHSYFWDCDKFNPINNECIFGIHFKLEGEKRRDFVFKYDWRLWQCGELQDILEEAGFKHTTVFWEEDDEDGEGGNGVFYQTKEAENSESWIAYIGAYS